MRYSVLIFVFLFYSCIKTTGDNELSNNQSKWERKNISDYEFTLRISCFCPQESAGPHLIKVVNDEIVSVNDQPYDPAATGVLMTIDELFTFVKAGIDGNPYRKTIEYNSTYGYPQYVFFDYRKTMVDEEIGYQLSDFKVI
jgi:hypothetical protein